MAGSFAASIVGSTSRAASGTATWQWMSTVKTRSAGAAGPPASAGPCAGQVKNVFNSLTPLSLIARAADLKAAPGFAVEEVRLPAVERDGDRAPRSEPRLGAGARHYGVTGDAE